MQKIEEFIRRLQRAVQSQKPSAREDVCSEIRIRRRFPGEISFGEDGVLKMQGRKNNDQVTFHLNAFTGETSHPNFAEMLAKQMLLEADFLRSTEPTLNAALFSLAVGVYEVPTDTGTAYIKVNRSVSGHEMLDTYMSVPEEGNPLNGLDLEKLTAPGGPAEMFEIPRIVRWVPADVTEAQDIAERDSKPSFSNE